LSDSVNFVFKCPTMIKSMTGFGKASRQLGSRTVNVEVKCLNSKGADISIRMPALYREGENEVRNEISRILQRGKIEATVWFETDVTDKAVSLNEGVITDYLAQFRKMESTLGMLGMDVLLPVIMRMPDVVKVEKQDFQEEEWKQVLETIGECMAQVDSFRKQEGQSVERDFRERIRIIREGIVRIRAIEKFRIERLRSRLGQAIQEITEKTKVDGNRFEQELIYYIEKIDINEEMVRLENHCTYFLETMDQEESQGRKLGFISQEIGREINTIGSKANDSDIQRIVVEMKDELEKIKEQTLNIL